MGALVPRKAVPRPPGGGTPPTMSHTRLERMLGIPCVIMLVARRRIPWTGHDLFILSLYPRRGAHTLIHTHTHTHTYTHNTHIHTHTHTRIHWHTHTYMCVVLSFLPQQSGPENFVLTCRLIFTTEMVSVIA
jgi:hypothetical protein